MKGLLWNVLLALVWLALSGSFSGWNLLFGFVLSYGILAVLERNIPALRGYPQRLSHVAIFLFFFIQEMIRANLRVAFDILTPTVHMQPGVIALELEAKTEFEIMLVANFISLTPGTLSLDVSDDHRMLFIHAMFAQDEAALYASLKTIERRLLDILRTGAPR